jgi:signal transduction histidine kinase
LVSFGSGLFFYKKQVNSTVDLILNDLAQDISTSQYLQAERRVEILRRLGFSDLKLDYSALKKEPLAYCALDSQMMITLDGIDVGTIYDCPRVSTIFNFVFGSNIQKMAMAILLLVFFLAVTWPLYRYQKSIQRYISESKGSGFDFRKEYQGADPVVLEIHSVLKSIYFSKLKIDELEYENKKSNALILQARQVAHDIRSPLSALNVISSGLGELTDEKISVFHSAIQRINDIANDLLKKGKALPEADPSSTVIQEVGEPPVEVSKLVRQIVSEKRIQFQDKRGIEIAIDHQMDHQDAEAGISAINASDFKRILSNLVNNSVESFSKDVGKVTVAIRTYTSKIQVTILDNGCGTPPEVISRIGEKDFSFGKHFKQSGSGLGVYHAKKTVESAGGSFSFQSEVGIGTIVSMTLPRL